MVLGMVVSVGEYHELGERRYCPISCAAWQDEYAWTHNSVSSFGLTMAKRQCRSVSLRVGCRVFLECRRVFFSTSRRRCNSRCTAVYV